MTAFWFIVVALATYRLTRLVTADKITEPIRRFVEVRSQWLGYLVTCDWCLSIWVAPLPALVAIRAGDRWWVQAGLVALGASALTGLFSLVERRLDS
jgi:hypothetical protein